MSNPYLGHYLPLGIQQGAANDAAGYYILHSPNILQLWHAHEISHQ